jgi:hypothetical protein
MAQSVQVIGHNPDVMSIAWYTELEEHTAL